MRVFVAGATGAIGRRLIPMLVDRGHDVSAMTRSPGKVGLIRGMGASPVVCDALDAVALKAAVSEQLPDAIVHELTDLRASLKSHKLATYYAANNRVRKVGTQNLLAAAEAADVNWIVAQSSASWYRPTGGWVKNEDDPVFVDARPPIGEAVRTMVEAEEAMLEHPSVSAVILRYGVFYGPGTWYAPDGDVGRMVARRRYPIIGHGEGLTSFVHIDDAARATVDALAAPVGIYNIVDDEPARLNDWLPWLARALGAKNPRRVPASLARLLAGPGAVDWLETQRGADNARAKASLRWTPRFRSWRVGFVRGMRG